MPNYNQILIVGHVGNPEELKYLPNGSPVLRFSIAVNIGYGEKKKAIWYRCSLFGKTAESIKQYVTKGTAVLVAGEHSNSEWTGQDGKTRFSNEVRVDKIQLMGSGNGHKETQDDQPHGQEAPAPNAPQQSELPDSSDVPF